VFFCALGDSTKTIGEELGGVIREFLPDELHEYEEVSGVCLVDHLTDPIDFADTLHDALAEILVAPFNARYAVVDEDLSSLRSQDVGILDGAAADVLQLVAEIAEQVYQDPTTLAQGSGVSLEQLLADLESLEWIVRGGAVQREDLLNEICSRYASVSTPRQGEPATVGYLMRECVLRLQTIQVR
jgi:hypothetical protein